MMRTNVSPVRCGPCAEWAQLASDDRALDIWMVHVLSGLPQTVRPLPARARYTLAASANPILKYRPHQSHLEGWLLLDARPPWLLLRSSGCYPLELTVRVPSKLRRVYQKMLDQSLS